MKKNMGKADRLIRTVIGMGIILFYVRGFIPYPFAAAALIIAGVFIVTSIFAVCPLYSMLSISTCSRKKANE